MTKSFWAKVAGWGQFAVETANEVLQTNGGVIPNTKAAWFRLIGSLLLAGGVHHASNTSGVHPNGAA